jgi:predicted transcriptional regulator YdeE
LQNKDIKKMGTKPTRDTRAKKDKYVAGTLTEANKKSKEDYDKINFKNDAWNKVTALTPKNKLQKSNTPFSKVRNFMGFGDAPQLNKKK